ncbi:MAG TPA: hypothetical protein VFF73_16570, partial [Planctomycetota bacterium]|nr:hypothetical protein [Planctomycetota bacterium]
MNLLRVGLVVAVALVAPQVRADDQQTPEQKKAAQKEKDLKKAKDDMEKELKAKKVDPAPALNMLDKLAGQCGLDV